MRAEKNGRWFMAVFCAMLWLIGWAGTSFAETDVTAKVQVVKGTLAYDRAKLQSSLDVSLKNISQDVLFAPIKVVITSISTTAVTVANADGVTPEGKPYFSYSMETDMLTAGLSTAKKRWIFSNPKAVKFSYTIVVTSPGDAKIPDATVILSEETQQSLSSVSQDGAQFIFDDQQIPQVESLVVGDVLVFGVSALTPNGALRKVENVARTGSQTVVDTTLATMEDAFEFLNIDCSFDLIPANIQGTKALAKGVSFGSEALSRKNSDSADLGDFYINFNDVVLYDDDQDLSTTYDQVRISKGGLSLAPSINFLLNIQNWKLKKLEFSQSLVETIELELESGISASFLKRQYEIARYYLAPVLVGPVVLTPILTVNVGGDGKVSVGLTTGVTQKASLTAGLSYDNGTWSPIGKFTNDFTFDWPSPNVEASIKPYAGSQLSLLLYGTAGPYSAVNGYLEFIVDFLVDPWWELYGGLEASAGVRVEILGKTLADHEFPSVIGYRKLLAAAAPDPVSTFPIPDTGQTQSYTSTFGEDHDYSINTLSYTANNGTVTDNVTGLMWQQQDDGQTRTWEGAIAYCEGLSLANQTDWRLPTKKELVSIVDYGRYYPYPSINPIFTGTVASYYRSSTTYASNSSLAWFVYFGSGHVDYSNKSNGGYYYVRCVRGGQ